MTYYVPGDDSTCSVTSGEIVLRPGDSVLVHSLAPTWVRSPRDARYGHRADVFVAAGSQPCEVQDFGGATLATLNAGEHATVVYEAVADRWTPYTGGGAAVATPPVVTVINNPANVATTPGTDGSYLVVDTGTPPKTYYERIQGEWVQQGGSGAAQTLPQGVADVPAMTALAPQPVGYQVTVADDGNGLPRTFISDGTTFVPLAPRTFNVADTTARDALVAYRGDFVEVADDGTGSAATDQWDGNSWNREAPVSALATATARQEQTVNLAANVPLTVTPTPAGAISHVDVFDAARNRIEPGQQMGAGDATVQLTSLVAYTGARVVLTVDVA